jgi:hypothetical protein
MKLTHIVGDDVANVLCKADLGCCIFSLRNPPVIGGGRHGHGRIENRRRLDLCGVVVHEKNELISLRLRLRKG